MLRQRGCIWTALAEAMTCSLLNYDQTTKKKPAVAKSTVDLKSQVTKRMGAQTPTDIMSAGSTMTWVADSDDVKGFVINFSAGSPCKESPQFLYGKLQG